MRLIFKNWSRKPMILQESETESGRIRGNGPCTAGRKRRADGSAGRNESVSALRQKGKGWMEPLD